MELWLDFLSFCSAKEEKKGVTYVWGNGCVKTGGSLTGSLGFESVDGLAAFDSDTDATFFGGALESDEPPDGFGAVIDGNGGDTTVDDVEPIKNVINVCINFFTNYHYLKRTYFCLVLLFCQLIFYHHQNS